MKIYLADGRVGVVQWLNVELEDGSRLTLVEDGERGLRVSALDTVSITPLASNAIMVSGR